MSFDLCSCSVAIGGDIRAVVAKPNVTIAEILLLQSIHGSDAVTNIRVRGDIKTSSDQERDRLGKFYGDDKVVGVFNQFGELPKTLSDSRIPEEMLDPVWKSERVRSAPKTTAKARKPVKALIDPAVEMEPEEE